MQKQRTLTKQWMQACLRCKGFTQLFFRNIFPSVLQSPSSLRLTEKMSKTVSKCEAYLHAIKATTARRFTAQHKALVMIRIKKPAKTRHFHTSRPGFLWEGASAAKAELPSEMTNHNQHNFRSIQVPGSSSVLFCNNVFKCKQDLKGSTDAWKTMSIAALFYSQDFLLNMLLCVLFREPLHL